MSSLRLLALAGLFAAAPVLAQEAAVLGGWALPEGTTVISVSQTQSASAAQLSGRSLKILSLSNDSTQTILDRVEGGRLMRAVQTDLASERQSTVNGVPSPPRSPDPMLGRPVVIERRGDEWRQRPDGWRPTAEQREALADAVSLDDAEYPTTPLAVGDTYVVPDSALRRVYVEATDGPHRLTVRLGSLGTRDGAPVAYITQEVQVEVGDPEALFTMDMTARIVRRLDWMLDVETVWEGETTTTYPEVTFSGSMRRTTRQTAHLP